MLGAARRRDSPPNAVLCYSCTAFEPRPRRGRCNQGLEWMFGQIPARRQTRLAIGEAIVVAALLMATFLLAAAGCGSHGHEAARPEAAAAEGGEAHVAVRVEP